LGKIIQGQSIFSGSKSVPYKIIQAPDVIPSRHPVDTEKKIQQHHHLETERQLKLCTPALRAMDCDTRLDSRQRQWDAAGAGSRMPLMEDIFFICVRSITAGIGRYCSHSLLSFKVPDRLKDRVQVPT
jgi:hypothetical protein